MIALIITMQITVAAPVDFHLAAGIGYPNHAYKLQRPLLSFRTSLLIAPRSALSATDDSEITAAYKPLTVNRNVFLQLLTAKPEFEGWQNILSVRDAISVDTTLQGINMEEQNNVKYLDPN
jgi:hypothetical protein